MVKYFKYVPVKGEYTTYKLLADQNEDKVKEYLLDNDENRTHVFSIEYDKEATLTAFKKKQEQIKLIEINENEFKELRNSTEQYQVEHEANLINRSIELGKSVIELEELSTVLDADELALSRFTYLVTLANAKYNMAVTSGIEPSEAVKVYDTSFNWKKADNTWVEIKVSDIVNALEKGVMNLQTIWKKYN